MLVTLFGIVTFPLLVVPSISIPLTITNGFSFCLFSNHFVPLNASSPMVVTLLGIVILVRFEQPLNAQLPMLVTLSGIITLVNDDIYVSVS